MSDVMGDQIVFVYSMIGHVNVLYVAVSVSLVFPQWVDANDLSMFIDCLDLLSVFCMWLEKVSFGSNVRPSILGFLTVGSGVLFICSVSVVL